jgi:methyl-accepting chemotaxis protein
MPLDFLAVFPKTIHLQELRAECTTYGSVHKYDRVRPCHLLYSPGYRQSCVLGVDVKLKLSTKVNILVAVTFSAFLALAVILVFREWGQITEARNAVLNFKLLESVSSLVTEVQRERGATASFLSGGISSSELMNWRDKTDARIPLVQEALKNSRLNSVTIHHLQGTINKIKDARLAADSRQTADLVIPAFTGIVKDLLRSYRDVSQQNSLEALEVDIKSISIIETAKENAGRLRALMTGILTRDQPVQAAEFTALIDFNAGIMANLSSPGLQLQASSQEMIASFRSRSHWKNVEEVFSKIIHRASQGKFEEDPRQFFATITRLVDDIDILVNAENLATLKKVDDIYSTALNRLWMIGSSLVFLSLILFVLVQRMLRTITKPLNLAIERLLGTGKIINDTSSQLQGASLELSSGAQETAASLQETVSTMSEMNSMIAQNLGRSRDASELADFVTGRMKLATEIMQDMAHAMNAIQDANQKLEGISRVITEISDKTNVINDIVFKTQLLSFNASIEAARAGQHGRGFAVVAEEVGNLARTSGNAANEIRALIADSQKQVTAIINDTQQKVAHGTKVGEKAEEIFRVVLDEVAKIASKAKDVANASQEQKQGIEQVTIAMSSIDQATQSNSAAASQTSTLAADLDGQNKNLMAVVEDLYRLVHAQERSEAEHLPADRQMHAPSRDFGASKEPAHSPGHGIDPELVKRIVNKASVKQLQVDHPDLTADDESFIQKAG